MVAINNSMNTSTSSSSSSSKSRSGLEQWYLDSGNKAANYFDRSLASLPTAGYSGDRYAELTGLQQSGIGQGNQYINQSAPLYQMGVDVMGKGASLMSGAYDQLSGAGQYDPDAMMQHLNPYINGALGTMTNLANRNLMENVMPGVNSTFTGAGQFGSTRNAEFLNRAIRDNQEGIQNNAATMLNNAYGQAANDYQAWGNMGLNAAQSMGTVGNQMGALGQQVGQYGITGLNTGMNLGQLDQQAQQQALDAQKAAWTEKYTFPVEIYGGLSQAFNNAVGRLSPTSTSSSSSSSSSTSYGTSSGLTI